MRCVPTLLRRELNAYFASVVGYIVTVLFLFVIGLFFKEVVDYLSQSPAQVSPMNIVFSMFWLPLLVVVPAITMRLVAEEKRSGTIELLMTAPVTEAEVVIAKWLGAVILYTLMWALTGFYVLILGYFARGFAALDYGPILGGYLGVLCTGQFFIALGLLASAFTRNQIAAFLISFAINFFFTLFFYWEQSLSASGKWAAFLKYVSPFDHMQDFTRGLVDLRPLALYASGTVVVLFLAVRTLESRNWR